MSMNQRSQGDAGNLRKPSQESVFPVQLEFKPSASRITRTGSLNAQLTNREGVVLELIGRGLDNKQIAEEMKITEGGVKSYVATIRVKTGARDRHQLKMFVGRLMEGVTQ